VLHEETRRQPDRIAANTERHRLRGRIDTPAGAQAEAVAEIEDARIRVNLQAAAEAGKRYKRRILDLVRADVTEGFAGIRTWKAALVGDNRIERRGLVRAVR
jgi:hypothetical protein